MIAALNDLDVLAFDIQNSYLMVDCIERVYVVAGPEFGSEDGNNMMVKKAFYGLKISGAAFRAFLADTLDAMGYWMSYADPDLWLQPAVNLGGFKYYEYILFYVDDMLCNFHNTPKSMKRIQDNFKLKDNKIEPGSTKKRGTTVEFYMLRGKLEYMVFLP